MTRTFRWKCKTCSALVIAMTSVDAETPDEAAARAIESHRRGCSGALERIRDPGEPFGTSHVGELIELEKIRRGLCKKN